MSEMTWKDFLSQAQEFLKISEQLGDGWVLHEKDANEPNTFLKYSHKIKCQESKDSDFTLINVEYHIVYSVSYQVPMLFFQAHRSDGSLLDLEATWRVFMPDTASKDLYQMLTQTEHPVLFRPFMALHPCRTAEVLDQFGQPSANRVLTFISLYGPHVKLQLANAYGLSK
ncbi:ubiquitin-like-conjugating enzyme ATG10 [Drosophila pseudoobscura]|uniref:Ubiquitin-like-conjugating enzyme ATG10 n=1 Tax=Drosophila pseudoobscura pseudoobscura TaxID=46245 RepID=A0A6I8VVF9_DROPS|nr:ubiquitin-like-conjugating enzyme ATG10 [Drosophila pseudoobscura]XP_033235070.1 ubiquitin-like-conjugating enzyme ATG10 [Drosophila pseudoobscura]